MNKSINATKLNLILCLFFLTTICLRLNGKTGNVLSQYRPEAYVWQSQSENSSGSMPCGGGSIGLNVWAEDNDILFYAQRSGAFDENNTLLKAGRFRLSFPDRKSPSVFRQKLNLWDGDMELQLDDIHITIWVDVFQPVIHLSITSKLGCNATLSYESWRYRDRLIRPLEYQQCSYKFGKVKGLKTKADSMTPSQHGIVFYHVNPDSTVFDATAWEQGLQAFRKTMYNPLRNRISGGMLSCPDFSFIGTRDGIYASTDFRAWQFATNRPVKRTEITIALNDTQEGLTQFQNETTALCKHKASSDKSRAWWHSFWQRSYIKAEGAGATLSRNYTLFRYMLGCNAYGAWPTKFNGGLFTFDPVYVDKKYPFTPDFRRWGGGTFTAQNQRLVYWPMIKSGDFDMLKPQLDFYARILPTAMLRVKNYWGHAGACFPEQIENFGLPNIDEYGTKRPSDFDRGVEYNAWLEYTWDTILEFCEMALEAHQYGNLDIKAYLPLIKQSVIFFDTHYQWLAKKRGRKALDGDGHIVIYPGSGGETYKMAYNPANTIAGLQTVITSLCNYMHAEGCDSDSIAPFKAMLQRIPPLPYRTVEGHKMLSPAQLWMRVNNKELTQLYAVFPWRQYGVGKDDLETALNTWRYDPFVKQFKGIESWEQANIFAACLGLTDEAVYWEQKKLGDGPYRFPAFWGPGHDWAPDHNWGGSGMIGLQEMLLQKDERGNDIPLPAWPKNWPVKYKFAY